LAAYDAESGQPIWMSGKQQVSYASPAMGILLGKRQVLIVNESSVTGHDPDSGEILWEFDWPGKSNTRASVSQALAVGDDLVFVSKGYGAGAALYRMSKNADGVWQPPQQVWMNKTLKTKFSNVSLHEGFVYGLDDRVLSCVRLVDGQRMWKQQRYGYGQTLLVDDLILVAAENGELALVQASPDDFRELSRIRVLGGQTWNNPCLYGRMLLLRNAEEAVCYELPGITDT
jgi:outer membrane protein assembly factor BamB